MQEIFGEKFQAMCILLTCVLAMAYFIGETAKQAKLAMLIEGSGEGWLGYTNEQLRRYIGPYIAVYMIGLCEASPAWFYIEYSIIVIQGTVLVMSGFSSIKLIFELRAERGDHFIDEKLWKLFNGIRRRAFLYYGISVILGAYGAWAYMNNLRFL